ncbi:MAG: hypothetical protein ACE5R6_11505 [Candidatus Heimdallarchaeota archaeon]
MHRKLLAKAASAGIISLLLYLLVVILTTPNLTPLIAASIALHMNGIYIIGISVSVAVQMLIVDYGKILGCELPRKKTSGLNLFESAASSFFSFFALVAVGCCDTWLYILSFLPAIFGLGIASVMIRHSTLFAQLGLGLMVLTNLYAYFP